MQSEDGTAGLTTTFDGRGHTVDSPWPDAADCNLRAARPIALFVRDTHGDEALATLAGEAGLAAESFDRDVHWISLAQMEAFFAAAHRLLGSDARYMEACAYRLAEGFGPLRPLLWATTPRAVYHASASHVRAVLSIGTYEVVSEGRGRALMRYRTTGAESRLFCLLRQAQGAALPTAWRLPPGHFTENRCVAWGDDYCEYDIRWFDKRTWRADLAGLAVGGLAGAALVSVGVVTWPAWFGAPVIGLLAARVLSERRTLRSNLGLVRQLQESVRTFVEAHGRTKLELLDVHRRQRQWIRVIETQLLQRTEAVQQLAAELQRANGNASATPPGHDGSGSGRDLPEGARVETEQQAGLATVRPLAALVHELAAPQLPYQPSLEALSPRTLTDRLRDRLAAMCQGHRIRAAVFASGELPEALHTDRFILDRVLDNLLIQAVEDTDRGSILVELGVESPDLVITVSDTGHGRLAPLYASLGARSLAPRRVLPLLNAPGFAITLAQLEAIGGRIELKSEAGRGSTVWLRIPLEPPTLGFKTGSLARVSDVFHRVVTIRRDSSA